MYSNISGGARLGPLPVVKYQKAHHVAVNCREVERKNYPESGFELSDDTGRWTIQYENHAPKGFCTRNISVASYTVSRIEAVVVEGQVVEGRVADEPGSGRSLLVADALPLNSLAHRTCQAERILNKSLSLNCDYSGAERGYLGLMVKVDDDDDDGTVGRILFPVELTMNTPSSSGQGEMTFQAETIEAVLLNLTQHISGEHNNLGEDLTTPNIRVLAELSPWSLNIWSRTRLDKA